MTVANCYVLGFVDKHPGFFQQDFEIRYVKYAEGIGYALVNWKDYISPCSGFCRISSEAVYSQGHGVFINVSR
jgi:hypothetical protein